MSPKTPDTNTCRVLVREVGYQGYITDQAGNTILVTKRGYGPGQPQLEPSFVLGPDADTNSDEYKEAAEQYRKGEIIELLKDDYARHKKYGVIADVGDEPEMEETALEEGEVAEASVDDLAAWIINTRPTVQEVINASEGDPDLARKLLEAESKAQDGNPRKGVFEGLSTVIGRG